MSFSSPNAETTRLILTAVGASFAGAALAIGVMSRMLKSQDDNNYNDPYGPGGMRKRSGSFIFEDPEVSLSQRGGSSSNVLFPHNHEEKMRRLIATRASVEDENSVPRQLVVVRVPATSANMGPGCEYNTMQASKQEVGVICCGIARRVADIVNLPAKVSLFLTCYYYYYYHYYFFNYLLFYRRHDWHGG